IRHLFILNPEAGIKNPVEEATKRIKHAFILNTHREDEKYDIVLTKKRGDATEIAKKACLENPGYTRIYACGGDGTLHEVASGIIGEKNVALCPIPVGSGNDFVRCFDLPKDRFLDIASLIHHEPKPCDMLKCDDFYALNNISAGLDAITGMRQQKVKKLPLVPGEAAYKIALGYSFLSAMKNEISFEIDGEPIQIGKGFVTLAVVGNGRFYGGGFKATPYAEIDDGWMDFVTVPTISRLEFLKYVNIYKNGTHIEKMPFVHFRKCKKIKMISPEPITLQADGEIFVRENPEIEILPSAINLIVPKKEENDSIHCSRNRSLRRLFLHFKLSAEKEKKHYFMQYFFQDFVCNPVCSPFRA
ncbi:MAG: diacylglycerol kinase family lipid kinase, partial [Clostridia bacterium]|nr:diacylglycerol kinase family lipid kinase [Clostridia bacterium]